jgi:hypothetical protein
MEILRLFKADLWKDQRRLETAANGANETFIKHFDSELDAQREAEVVDFLSNRLQVARVPSPIQLADKRVTFPYIRGIRVFNLFVELDRIKGKLGQRAEDIKRQMLARCESNQREIQKGLSGLRRRGPLKAYKIDEKILSVVKILSACLGIVVDWDRLREEMHEVAEVWSSQTTVPFRDATTKNMVLGARDLWLGGFESEESRREYLIGTLNDGWTIKWAEAPIFDFDFSSCVDFTTPEDDVISLKFHERTWSGAPSKAEELVWGEYAPDPTRAALTFLLRYYRFGGRKAAYRLLHPNGHRIRFRHDNDIFYFERLPSLVSRLWPEAERKIPALLNFTRTVSRTLNSGRPSIDHFMAAGLAERRRYYVDMYPE